MNEHTKKRGRKKTATAKEPKLSAYTQAEAARMKRQARYEPLHRTLNRDYSQMQAVRIDHRTVIYIKPGQDPEAAKETYLQIVARSKPLAPAQRVSNQVNRPQYV